MNPLKRKKLYRAKLSKQKQQVAEVAAPAENKKQTVVVVEEKLAEVLQEVATESSSELEMGLKVEDTVLTDYSEQKTESKKDKKKKWSSQDAQLCYSSKMTKKTYKQIGEEIGSLVDKKNAAYGSSFAECHKILSVLYPSGIKPEQYTDALAIIRVIDKLFRIANNKDAFGESPWNDIAGYAILGIANHDKK